MKPQVENPGKIFGRLVRYLMKRYLFHFLAVLC